MGQKELEGIRHCRVAVRPWHPNIGRPGPGPAESGWAA